MNLGRLFSLPVLVSLQSLVCLAGKPMAGLMAVQDPPSLKDIRSLPRLMLLV